MNEFYDFSKYVRLFKKAGDPVVFKLWGDKDKTLKPKEIVTDLDHLEEIYPVLADFNRQGYAICMIINNGGRKNDEITKITAHFYESDELSKSDQLEMVKRLPPPSAMVETKRSIHCFFLADDSAKVKDFTPIQKKLIKCQNGDPALSDNVRSMRCPGFYHNKGDEPYLCRLIDYHPERVYNQQEFETVLDSLLAEEGGIPEGSVVPAADDEEKPAREDEKGTLTQLDFMCSECLFIQHCKKNAGILSEPDWLGMITNMAVFEGGPERIHEYSRSYPRYSVDDTNRKIEHFLSSSTKPMRCRTLAEKGFVCPKLKENGGCPGAKAPAALPFKLKDVAVSHINKMKWYRATKTGFALSRGVLAEELKNKYHSVYSSGRFFLYKDGFYQMQDDLEVEKIIQDHLIPEYSTYKDIKDIYNQWSMKVYSPPEKLNSDKKIINVKNGLFDVHEGVLYEHTPDYLSTIQINASYDPESSCPTFIQFITESLGAEYVPLIARIAGYICTTSVAAEKAFFLVGAAAGGKSTLIKAVEHVVGRRNRSSITWQSLGEPFQAADLFGKILNSNADLPSKALDDAGMFKKLVSGDSISTSRKFKDNFEFYPFVKFLFSCNDMPVSLSDRTIGFFRRIILIPFTRTVPESKRDPHLLDKLLAERDGILTFAIRHLRDLVANNYRFVIPERSKEEMKKYMQACNSAILFLNEHCKVSTGGEILRQELYQYYVTFCNRFSLKPMSQNNFNRDVEKMFTQDELQRSRTSGKRLHTWVGISYDANGECDSGDFDYVLGLTSTPAIVGQIEQQKQQQEALFQSLQGEDDLLGF